MRLAIATAQRFVLQNSFRINPGVLRRDKKPLALTNARLVNPAIANPGSYLDLPSSHFFRFQSLFGSSHCRYRALLRNGGHKPVALIVPQEKSGFRHTTADSRHPYKQHEMSLRRPYLQNLHAHVRPLADQEVLSIAIATDIKGEWTNLSRPRPRFWFANSYSGTHLCKWTLEHIGAQLSYGIHRLFAFQGTALAAPE